MAASIFREITTAWLKSTFLAGVDLTDDDGDPLPDALFEQALAGAARTLERELALTFDPIALKGERHDGHEINRGGWWNCHLNERPVWGVDAWRLQYGKRPIPTENMPLSWIHLDDHVHGKVQLVPDGASIGSSYFTNGVPVVLGSTFRPEGYLPGFFSFDYTAGFAQEEGVVEGVADGPVEVAFGRAFPSGRYRLIASVIEDATEEAAAGVVIKLTERSSEGFKVQLTGVPAGAHTLDWYATAVPSDILHALGLMAAMLPLDVAGDLILGAGIASMSLGVDGLSQSIGTTSSATNAGYGARVRQFERELKLSMPALKSTFSPINLGVF